MVTIFLVAMFFAVAVLGLYLHHKSAEGAYARIRALENTVDKLEKENLRLTGRLDTCNFSVERLQAELEECEKSKRELALCRDQS